MKFLKSKKVKVTAMFLVVAIMGGVIWNTGVTKKSKAEKKQELSLNDNLVSSELYEKATASMDDIVSKIEASDIIYSKDNRIYYDEKRLKGVCDDIDYTSINEYNEIMGITRMNSDNMAESIEENIKIINDCLMDGQYVMLADGTVTTQEEVNSLTKGGKNSTKVEWWGVTRYMSTKKAASFAHELQSIANRNMGIGAVAGGATLLFGVMVIPAIVGGVSGAYLSEVANDINYVNGQTNKGVKAKLYWVFKHEIKPQ